jgi:hypothetical protein
MKDFRYYINLVESLSKPVTEAPVDPKFAGFMNKTLNNPDAKPNDPPEFMQNAPGVGSDDLGYAAAVEFGIRTLKKLTPTQKTKLAIKGEEAVVDWLARQAKRQGLLFDENTTDDESEDEDNAHMFTYEDLDEIQADLPKIFNDPDITSWALVLTDGEPLPQAPFVGPFRLVISDFMGEYTRLDYSDNFQELKTLAQELAQKRPDKYIGVADSRGEFAFYHFAVKPQPGEKK